MQNGLVESFNGRKRDELLNETLFIDVDHARWAIGVWVADYILHRPHALLGYLTLAAFAANLAATGDQLRNPTSFADRLLLNQSRAAHITRRL